MPLYEKCKRNEETNNPNKFFPQIVQSQPGVTTGGGIVLHSAVKFRNPKYVYLNKKKIDKDLRPEWKALTGVQAVKKQTICEEGN